MRLVCFDTETTGLNPKTEQVIEIAAVEIWNRKITGKFWHTYVKPAVPVSPGSFHVHGISDDFLHNKPIFADVIEEFLTFIKDADIVAHNAPFDLAMLNSEIQRLNNAGESYQQIEKCCNGVIDTMIFAKQKFTGAVNLDAVVKKLGMVNLRDQHHGALIDTQMLAKVYLALTGEQQELLLNPSSSTVDNKFDSIPNNQRTLQVIQPNQQEMQQHAAYMRQIQDIYTQHKEANP